MKFLLFLILSYCSLGSMAQNINLLRNGSWRPNKDLEQWKTADSIGLKRPFADSTGDINFTFKGEIQQFHTGRSSVLRGNKYVVHKTESWDIIGQYTLGKILTLVLGRKTIVVDIVSLSQTQLVLMVKSVQAR